MTEYVSRTYALTEAEGEGGMYIKGKVDGIEALRQAIALMLQVEKDEYAIFSDEYGLQVSDLIGKPYPLVVAELERRIKETLLVDERVLAVDDFSFAAVGNRLSVRFVVKSIYGEDVQGAEVVI